MSANTQGLSDDQVGYWEMVVETWRGSGLSVRQFCEREGLSKASFYGWRRKLAGRDESASGDSTVSESGSFIEVSTPREGLGVLELVLCSGNTLRIGSGVDSGTLSDVISILQRARLC